MIDTWSAPDLAGVVALVTGARRSIGRGIAIALGTCGATVWVTTRPRPDTPDDGWTIEQTAALVTSAGGRGVAVVCDHDDPEQIAELCGRIDSDCGGLDLLVNNAVRWGPGKWFRPPWDQPLERWHDNVGSVTAHYTTTCLAVPLMKGRARRPLIVSTCEGPGHTDVATHQRYHGTAALIGALQYWTDPEGIDAIGVIPGEPRWHLEQNDERLAALHAAIVGCAGPDEVRAMLRRAPFKYDAKRIDYAFKTQSIEFPGRAIAALYTLPDRASRAGHMWAASDLARDYGFTDVDGLQPA